MAAWNGHLATLVGVIAVVCGGCQPQGTGSTTAATASTLTNSPPKEPPPIKPSDAPETSAPKPAASGPAPVVKLTVGKEPNYVNLIPKDAPPTPKFSPLDKKPGYLRGYVKDAAGNPLQGAYIGVRSTLIGGRYSGASAESDEKGYYEVQVPQGAAHFYAAGYTVDYADGRAALTLHPADGKLTSFASVDGSVENFVLWTYGVADKDKMSENPSYRSNFYGGSLYIGHHVDDPGDALGQPHNLKTGTEIEITLTPAGKLLDGSIGKKFVIKKAVFSTGFSINNIPVGQYRLTVKRADGQPLRTKLNKPRGLTFGIAPEETTESAILSLHPGGAKAGMATPGRGNWEAVEVYVEIPKK
ncbi:hypothetical protein VT84_29700 [Gemmata sp. SH-PL17]|uniref:hypothetical protein n=1 Tax=Gemmata sp. SH-PL17 TaxID=1630693 RepID=UPI0004AD300D|nr:hypothetical protein [Gemmata sp. SH-PL17]AMV28616.1 hypothetical protein VT84_29700 [Gemmata sp. SH-PL17]